MTITLNNNDVVRCRITTRLPHSYAMHLLYFRVALNGGALDTSQAAQAIADTHAPSYLTCLSGVATLDTFEVDRVYPTFGVGDAAVSVYGGNGFGGDTLLPWQLCGLITMQFAERYRGPWGRFYMPFLPETATEGSYELTPDYWNSLDLHGSVILNTFIAPVSGGPATLTPVIYRRVSNTFVLMTGKKTHTQIATQRRRGQTGKNARRSV